MSAQGAVGATVVADPTGFDLSGDRRRLIRWTVYIGYFALFAGVAHGLAQALAYAGIDILQYFPALRSYYQGLTAHGVANALFFTFAFSNGFLPLLTARALNRPLNHALTHATLWTLVAANVLVIYAITTNQASVLYTAYAPLQGHWTFYLGLVLLVVSTYLASANMFLTLWAWKKENPGERIPLLAFISVVSYAMWDLASLGVAVSFIGFLLPWSLGLIERDATLLSELVTHRLPLADAVEGYRMFAAREDGCTKVVLETDAAREASD